MHLPQNLRLDKLVGQLDEIGLDRNAETDLKRTVDTVVREVWCNKANRDTLARVVRRDLKLYEDPDASLYIEELLLLLPEYIKISMDIAAQSRTAYLLNRDEDETK